MEVISSMQVALSCGFLPGARPERVASGEMFYSRVFLKGHKGGFVLSIQCACRIWGLSTVILGA